MSWVTVFSSTKEGVEWEKIMVYWFCRHVLGGVRGGHFVSKCKTLPQ